MRRCCCQHRTCRYTTLALSVLLRVAEPKLIKSGGYEPPDPIALTGRKRSANPSRNQEMIIVVRVWIHHQVKIGSMGTKYLVLDLVGYAVDEVKCLATRSCHVRQIGASSIRLQILERSGPVAESAPQCECGDKHRDTESKR